VRNEVPHQTSKQDILLSLIGAAVNAEAPGHINPINVVSRPLKSIAIRVVGNAQLVTQKW